MNSTATREHTDVEAPGIEALRDDFPILTQAIGDHALTYLDSAASAQMPVQVIDEIRRYQMEDHANVHRGVHTLSHRATDLYESARQTLAALINARHPREVIFTRGTTEAINLVAGSYAAANLRTGDSIIVTELEHHSNIVPWQLACEKSGARLKVAPVHDNGDVDSDEIVGLMDDSTRLIAIAQVSNVLGTRLPVADVIRAAHERGIPVLLDAAQAVPHSPVDVRALDVDFLAFSGHKMFGPTGIGVLYGKEAILDAMPPWQSGGAMIREVSFSGTTFNDLPYKFEAGTPNISGAVGMAAAARYLMKAGLTAIEQHVDALLHELREALLEVDGIRLIGTSEAATSVQSMLLRDIHPHDLGTILDHQGVAVRTGHHCAMPLMKRFGIPGTVRAALALYNNKDDIDRLVDALRTADKVFAV